MHKHTVYIRTLITLQLPPHHNSNPGPYFVDGRVELINFSLPSRFVPYPGPVYVGSHNGLLWRFGSTPSPSLNDSSPKYLWPVPPHSVPSRDLVVSSLSRYLSLTSVTPSPAPMYSILVEDPTLWLGYLASVYHLFLDWPCTDERGQFLEILLISPTPISRSTNSVMKRHGLRGGEFWCTPPLTLRLLVLFQIVLIWVVAPQYIPCTLLI